MIPCAERPEWFIDELQLPLSGTVIVLDDDPSIHELWKYRLRELLEPGSELEVVHLHSGIELAAHVDRLKREGEWGRTACFIDHELLGEEKTGLDLVDSLQISAQSVLVTGRFDEESLQARVRWLGVKMLPKPLLAIAPITLGAEV